MEREKVSLPCQLSNSQDAISFFTPSTQFINKVDTMHYLVELQEGKTA